MIPQIGFWIMIVLIGASGNVLADEKRRADFDPRTLTVTGCRRADQGRCRDAFSLTPENLGWPEAHARMVRMNPISATEPAQCDYRTDGWKRNRVTTVNLAEQGRAWLALTFSPENHGATEEWVQSTGNILDAFRSVRGNASKTAALIDRLEQEFPRVWAVVHSFLPEWVRDDDLFRKDWDPYRTGDAQGPENDGILERPPFIETLQGQARMIYQASAVIFADIETITAFQLDFARGPDMIGVNNIEIVPLEAAFFVGEDPDGRGFLFCDVYFHQKPFPFLSITHTLRHLIHVHEGRWGMLIDQLSGDFHQMRLRMFYDPIDTTRGERIGFLTTVWLDVDVKHLPDRDKDRMAGARIQIGNIKRWVETDLGKQPNGKETP